jgi:hypothetical protein
LLKQLLLLLLLLLLFTVVAVAGRASSISCTVTFMSVGKGRQQLPSLRYSFNPFLPSTTNSNSCSWLRGGSRYGATAGRSLVHSRKRRQI